MANSMETYHTAEHKIKHLLLWEWGLQIETAACVHASVQTTSTCGKLHLQICSSEAGMIPSDSLVTTSDTTATTKCDVKLCLSMYRATSARVECAFGVLLHMNSLLFTDMKQHFWFSWVTLAQKSQHRGNQFEILWVCRMLDKVTRKRNAISRRQATMGTAKAVVQGSFRHLLGFSFLATDLAACLHVAAWKNRFP